MCVSICAAANGYQKCWDEGFEIFSGCDLLNYTDDYDVIEKKVMRSFPCEKCEEKFQEWEQLKEHFIKTHLKKEMICCPVKKCDFKTKSVNDLIMHIGVRHKELVRKRL